jgi:hypothetical protein
MLMRVLRHWLAGVDTTWRKFDIGHLDFTVRAGPAACRRVLLLVLLSRTRVCLPCITSAGAAHS